MTSALNKVALNRNWGVMDLDGLLNPSPEKETLGEGAFRISQRKLYFLE